MLDPDELLALRALATLGDDLAGAAAVAVAGLDHARRTGDHVIVPLGTHEAARAAFDAAARVARWLPHIALPPTPEEVTNDAQRRR